MYLLTCIRSLNLSFLSKCQNIIPNYIEKLYEFDERLSQSTEKSKVRLRLGLWSVYGRSEKRYSCDWFSLDFAFIGYSHGLAECWRLWMDYQVDKGQHQNQAAWCAADSMLLQVLHWPRNQSFRCLHWSSRRIWYRGIMCPYSSYRWCDRWTSLNWSIMIQIEE